MSADRDCCDSRKGAAVPRVLRCMETGRGSATRGELAEANDYACRRNGDNSVSSAQEPACGLPELRILLHSRWRLFRPPAAFRFVKPHLCVLVRCDRLVALAETQEQPRVIAEHFYCDLGEALTEISELPGSPFVGDRHHPAPDGMALYQSFRRPIEDRPKLGEPLLSSLLSQPILFQPSVDQRDRDSNRGAGDDADDGDRVGHTSSSLRTRT
jgi:hypothetical protein